MLSRSDYRELLRIAKTFVKMSTFINQKGLSQSAVSRFTTDPDYNMISIDTLDLLTSEIYNMCCTFKDIYEETKKVA